MGALRVCVSASGADRLSCAGDVVRACAPGTRVLIVGATRGAADDLARSVAATAPATFGLQRLSLTQLIQRANKAWHGVKLGQPDWGPSSHSLAITVELEATRQLVHLIFNAYWEPLEFELPSQPSRRTGAWRRWIDTALPSPNDIVASDTAPTVSGPVYRAEDRSVVVLVAEVG